jgi:aerobic carbon-monoxide dehydrogenase medium subunit
MKFPHPASRFAVVGVAAVLTMDSGKIGKASIGITGAGTKAVRATGVEGAIAGKAADAASIQAAAEKGPDGVDVQADLQGSEEYKKHLLKVFCKRAIEAAAKK